MVQDIRRACRRGRRHAFHGLLLGLERDAITRHAMSFAGLKLPPGFRRRRPLALLGAGLQSSVSAGCDRRISTHRDIRRRDRGAIEVVGDADVGGTLIGVHINLHLRAGGGVTASRPGCESLSTGFEQAPATRKFRRNATVRPPYNR